MTGPCYMLKSFDRYPHKPWVQASLLWSHGRFPRSVTSHSWQVAETDTIHRLSPEARIWDLAIPTFHLLVLLVWLRGGRDCHRESVEGTQARKRFLVGIFLGWLALGSVKVLSTQACLETSKWQGTKDICDIRGQACEGWRSKREGECVAYELSVAWSGKARVC